MAMINLCPPGKVRGGQVVIVLNLYSDDPNLNPADVYNFIV